MNFLFKKIALIVLIGLPMHATEPSVIGWLTKSQPVYLFEKHVQTKIANLFRRIVPFGYIDELASPEYQELGRIAQEGVGISPERHVPIRKIDPKSVIGQVALATAEPDAIYINEEKLQQRTYGAQRCGMFHEAVHKKYHDNSADQIIELLTIVLGTLAAYKLMGAINTTGRYKILQGIGSLAAGFSIAGYVSGQYHYFMERRADIEGHYAAACSTCVQQAAAQRDISFNQQNSPLKHNGYLWAPDLEKIAADLARQNKLCTYHQAAGPIID